MSRSYKKNPWLTDHSCGSTKRKKQLANRIYRRKLKQLDDEGGLPKNYSKKVYESYNICDYKWMMTKKEAIKFYLNGATGHHFFKMFPTLESWLNYWEKCHVRK